MLNDDTARELHDYLQFRANAEGAIYAMDEDFFQGLLDQGMRDFFGVHVDDEGDVIYDSEQPRLFDKFFNG